MNESDKQKLATAVSQCKHHMVYGLPVDQFPVEVIMRAKKAFDKDGGQYYHKKPTNGNSNKEHLKVKRVNDMRGRATSEGGNWLEIDPSLVKVRIDKRGLNILPVNMVAIDSKELAELQEFKKRFEPIKDISNELIRVISLTFNSNH